MNYSLPEGTFRENKIDAIFGVVVWIFRICGAHTNEVLYKLVPEKSIIYS
jgi:hypothetical protein